MIALTMNDNNHILEIASRFNTDGNPVKAEPLGNGLINDTYIVKTDNDKRYVLQRINTDIFRDPALLQRNLKLITDHIRGILQKQGCKDIGRRVLTPVKTKKDYELYVKSGEEAWRMTEYIEGSHTEENLTPRMAACVGEAFANFHSYFATEDAPEISETIPDFHNIAFRLQQLRDAVRTDQARRLSEVKDMVDYLLSREEEMLRHELLHRQNKLPKRTAHCDTKVNNILFDSDGSILCVIDLDTVMPGFVLSDFGDFIRTGANTGKEDDENLDNVGVDMVIFRAFAEAYVHNAKFLTTEEKRLLPFGARLLTYMQTVRFLTDYINGDIYYKTQYPKHNLIRTRAQLKLLHDIDAHMDEMEQFITNIS